MMKKKLTWITVGMHRIEAHAQRPQSHVVGPHGRAHPARALQVHAARGETALRRKRGRIRHFCLLDC